MKPGDVVYIRATVCEVTGKPLLGWTGNVVTVRPCDATRCPFDRSLLYVPKEWLIDGKLVKVEGKGNAR